MGEGTDRAARAWLTQARHDLAAAEANANEGRHALACFLCHQAAEKAVTGFLYARGSEQVWGHALADLCEDALAFDPSFDLVKSVAVLLDKHYLGARYPSSLPGGVPAEAYDTTDAERAIETASDVLAAVNQRIGSGTV
ncbi:MAG: HEPN domain-containing protein [Dehalococcoidia bacterium]